MQNHENVHHCPGLWAGKTGLLWTDSLGRVHNLEACERVSVGGAALRLQRSTRSVLRKIRRVELYPVVRHSCRDIEVYVVGIDDYIARKVVGRPAVA